ncbi:MAG TPA: ANTAR domain-containing protein [Gemmatimonadaceae bacterium]|nr:ANTAR domain-containing protein [Gemmatimonadaceae bacterium]
MSSDPRSTTVVDPAPAAIRVLIAEDDADLRSALTRNLSAAGHAIVGEAETVRDAIDRARELVPDVLLLDAHLDPSHMVETAKAIALDHPQIAVIFLCGDTSFTLEGDLAGTSAISVLPSSSPTSVLESSIKLAAYRVRELRAARDEAADAKRQLENRKAIERAKGILMRRTGLSEQEAYRILQRTSQDRSVPMVDVAREVLDSEPGRT